MYADSLNWIGHLPYAEISPRAQTALRFAYGVFLLAQLVVTVPHAARFYVTRTRQGYIDDAHAAHSLHTPLSANVLMAIWIVAAVGIMCNVATLACATVNFALSRYFFLHLRWKSILRGMGAPGHMNYWFSVLTFLLALCPYIDRANLIHGLSIVCFRVDFACIMLAAGIYKLTAGYTRGEGFEIGLVNPWWGNFPIFARRLQADTWVFRILNHAAYGVELLAALMFFFPAVAAYGAIALGASFLVIGQIIRLTFLTEMVATACLLYGFPGDLIDRALAWLRVPPTLTPAAPLFDWPLVQTGIAAALSIYLILLLPAYAGMMTNLYGKRRLTPLVQTALDRWTRFCGLILWRVFTLDIINFYAEIFIERDGRRLAYAVPGERSVAARFRFAHVGEFICLASLFTTLKYYPENIELFERRLSTYARSLQTQPGDTVLFRYLHITKAESKFCITPVAEFRVELASGKVAETVLDHAFDIRVPAKRSPIRAGRTPGSYVPS